MSNTGMAPPLKPKLKRSAPINITAMPSSISRRKIDFNQASASEIDLHCHEDPTDSLIDDYEIMEATEAGKEEFGEQFELIENNEVSSDEEPRTKKEKKTKSAKMLEYFLKYDIYDFNALLERPKIEWTQWAAMPTFNALAASFYTMVSAGFQKKILIDDIIMNKEDFMALYPEKHGFNKIERLLKLQNYSDKRIKFFIYSILKTIDRKNGKCNTILFTGKPSSGKSAIAESLVNAFFRCSRGTPDNNPKSAFQWNDCVNKRVILWEEPHITADNVEDCKKVFGGQEHIANAKYKSGVTVPSTPCIVTSNEQIGKLFPVDAVNIFKTRCIHFTFTETIDDHKDFEFEWPITKYDWYEFFNNHEDVIYMVLNNKKFEF